MFICFAPAGKRLSKKFTKISSQEGFYLINLLWSLSEKQNFNKSTNLQAKTYFPLQNIVNMINNVNNELEMLIARNSLAVRKYFVSKQSHS